MLERANREISNSTAPGYDGAQHVLLRDYETHGVLALNKVGVHRYADDLRTTVLCCAYAVDNEPVKLWTPGDAIPPEFYEAAKNPNWLVVAHNAHFEMAIEQHILGPRFGWPLIPLEQQRCTMAMALALITAGQTGCCRTRARAAAPERCRRPPANADDGEAAQAAQR